MIFTNDDIYIMMKCVYVCLSRKMSTFLKGLSVNHESDVTWFHGFSWFLVGFHVFSRWFHGFHGFWLVSMVFQGGFMVFHGFWLVSMVFQGGFMVFHGFCWVFMVFQGGSWPNDPNLGLAGRRPALA